MYVVYLEGGSLLTSRQQGGQQLPAMLPALESTVVHPYHDKRKARAKSPRSTFDVRPNEGSHQHGDDAHGVHGRLDRREPQLPAAQPRGVHGRLLHLLGVRRDDHAVAAGRRAVCGGRRASLVPQAPRMPGVQLDCRRTFVLLLVPSGSHSRCRG